MEGGRCQNDGARDLNIGLRHQSEVAEAAEAGAATLLMRLMVRLNELALKKPSNGPKIEQKSEQKAVKAAAKTAEKRRRATCGCNA